MHIDPDNVSVFCSMCDRYLYCTTRGVENNGKEEIELPKHTIPCPFGGVRGVCQPPNLQGRIQ